jgi:hypothetical protein
MCIHPAMHFCWSISRSPSLNYCQVNTKLSCTFRVIASHKAARQSIRIQRDSEKGWIATSRQVVTRDDESPRHYSFATPRLFFKVQLTEM